MKKQIIYCKENKLPMFAPEDGICFSCNRRINDKGDDLITGCESCNYSFCE